MSESKNDEFFRSIGNVARGEDIKTALIIGAALEEGSTMALLAGIAENKNKPSVFCISTSRRGFGNLQKVASSFRTLKWHELSPSSREGISEEFRKTVEQIKIESHIEVFDVVLIDGSELTDQLHSSCVLEKELSRARFVLLDDINLSFNQKNYECLLRKSNYVLVDQNPALRNGYAIFEKESSARRPDAAVAGGVYEVDRHTQRSVSTEQCKS